MFPTGRRGQQLGIIDDLSWSLAKHTLQAGVNDRNRISDANVASGSVIGTHALPTSQTSPRRGEKHVQG